MLPHSGIVGCDDEQEWVQTSEERVLVYFEGNRYGYCNIKTWADRVRLAAGRARERYPTIAMSAVPRAALKAVGYINSDLNQISVFDEHSVADWCEQHPLPAAELGFT